MKQDIIIKEALNQKDYLAFVKFPFELFKNNPYWVPPLIKDELETIDPELNPIYKNATARFFLAYKGNKLVGRIAAMINWIEVNEIKRKKYALDGLIL